jgi:hypothetical protein
MFATGPMRSGRRPVILRLNGDIDHRDPDGTAD